MSVSDIPDCGCNILCPKKSYISSLIPAFPVDCLTSPTFQLLVGPKKESFYIHKTLLERKCPYFATLFNTSLPALELATNSVTFDSTIDSVSAWKLVIEWFYTKQYQALIWSAQRINKEVLDHTNVYVIAVKLCIDPLRKYSLEMMIKLLACGRKGYGTSPLSLEILPKVVELIYLGTTDEEYLTNEGNETGGNRKESNGDEKTSEKKTVKPGRPDPIRILVAQYVAAQILQYRKLKEFNDIIYGWPEFAADVLSFVGNGSEMSEEQFRTMNGFGGKCFKNGI